MNSTINNTTNQTTSITGNIRLIHSRTVADDLSLQLSIETIEDAFLATRKYDGALPGTPEAELQEQSDKAYTAARMAFNVLLDRLIDGRCALAVFEDRAWNGRSE
jgi:hypothetical protein